MRAYKTSKIVAFFLLCGFFGGIFSEAKAKNAGLKIYGIEVPAQEFKNAQDKDPDEQRDFFKNFTSFFTSIHRYHAGELIFAASYFVDVTANRYVRGTIVGKPGTYDLAPVLGAKGIHTELAFMGEKKTENCKSRIEDLKTLLSGLKDVSLTATCKNDPRESNVEQLRLRIELR